MNFNLIKKTKRFFFIFQKEEVNLFFFAVGAGVKHLKTFPLHGQIEELSLLLGEHPEAPLSIFHDTLDQTFQTEQMPAVLSGLDPYRWMRQKIHTFSQEAAFFSYLRLNKREIFFTSVPASLDFDRWAKAFMACGHPIEGFYALALEEISLFQRLQKILASDGAQPWLFALTLEPHGHMRHTVMHQGNFVLMRLLPPFSSNFLREEMALSEINATLRYLFKHTPDAQKKMDFLCLSNGLSPPLRSVVLEGKEWGLSFQKAASLLGIILCEETLGSLFLNYFAQTEHKPILALQPTKKKWVYQKNFFKKLSGHIGVIVGFILWIMGGYLWKIVYDFSTLSDALEKNIFILKAQSQSTTKELDHFLIPVLHMQRILNFSQSLNKTVHTPFLPLKKLSGLLLPHMIITQLDWISEDLRASSLTFEAYSFQALDPQALIALFDDFLSRIKLAFPTEKVTVIHAPYSTHPKQMYTGELSGEQQSPKPSIILKITWI